MTQRSYADLTEAERWNWHAEVYAFRRVVLGVSDHERKSPCDPEGIWFNEDMVRAAASRLRVKRQPRRTASASEEAAEGRALCDEWARERGFPDFAAAEMAGHTPIEVAQSLMALKAMPAPVRGRYRSSDYEPRATEQKFAPIPEGEVDRLMADMDIRSV